MEAGGAAAAADDDAAAAAAAAASRVAALEARVAALHKDAQRLNKIPGQEAAAAAVYRQLATLDDEALLLQLHHAPPLARGRAAAHAAAFPQYTHLLAPAPWAAVSARCSAAQLRSRALTAALGSALGDAAACSVQWVYSEKELQTLAQGRPGLEFFDPPKCPFFDYSLGASSPYGEQTAVLAHSLVAAGGLDCCRYAADLFAAFGPGFAGYRDRSCKAFLRRYAAGALPPLTGAADDQANAFTRLPPLVALFAGGGRARLLGAVERMVRVTQNDPTAVAYGCAAALVLEAVIRGDSATAAVAGAVDWLQQTAAAGEAAGDGAVSGGPAEAGTAEQQAVPAVPAALWGEVAARLLQAAELAPLPPLEAAAQLGRNCHLPNSLQTPLQVLLHLEWRQAGGEGDSAPADRGQAAPPSAGPPGAAPQAAAAVAAGADAAASGDFCLPCSMGGGAACPLPARRAGQGAAAAGGAALLRAARQQQQDEGSSPAALAPGAFIEAVRLAIRPGGCCASRAGFAGALAGALVAGSGGGNGNGSGDLALPREWMQRMTGWAEALTLAERLVALRD